MWRAVIVLLLCVGPARADDLDQFYTEYAPHWERITAHLWRNVKMTGTARECDLYISPGTPTQTVTFSAVASDTVMVRRQLITPAGGSPEPETAAVITPDQALLYVCDSVGAAWRQRQHIIPWSNIGSGRQIDYYYDTLAGHGAISLPIYRAYIGRGPNAYFRPLVHYGQRENFADHRTRHTDTEVFEVRLRSSSDNGEPVSVVRLRVADWLVASVELQGMPGPDGRPTTRTYKTDVTYSPAATGELPFPAAIRSKFVEPNGTETPGYDLTFTEYRRYTPTADELDPAKLFGLPLPDAGPRPPLPPPGEYLSDSDRGRPQTGQRPGRVPLWMARENDLRRDRFLRGGLLAAFIIAVGLVAVWWRR